MRDRCPEVVFRAWTLRYRFLTSLCEYPAKRSTELGMSTGVHTRSDESGSQPTGDWRLCPKAISISALVNSGPIAARAERARPQIHNRCFQGNRARAVLWGRFHL